MLATALVAVLVAPFPLRAALTAEEVARIRNQAFDHFYNLEYDEAIALFQRLRADAPRDPSRQNRLAMAYLYKQLYVAGALEGDLFGASNRFFRTPKIQEDPVLRDGFHRANQAAIQLCQQHLKEDPRDQNALYACGVAYATRATYQGLIERSLLGSLSSAGKANDFHTRLTRINPRYYDAYLVPGLYDFVLGSLPAPVRMLFFFAGLSGNKERGLKMVENVMNWGDSARYDARILLTVMYRREKRFADARRTLEELVAAFPRNYIFPLEVASLFRNAGEVPEAIAAYQRVLEWVRAHRPGFENAPVARIHYELGDLYRNQGELELALRHLQQVAGARGSTPALEQESALLQKQIEEELRQRAAPNTAGTF